MFIFLLNSIRPTLIIINSVSKRINRSIKEIAEDLDVPENLLYNWRRKFTANGEKTIYATMEEENREIRRQLAEVKMERDMLKKATAFFAKNQK